MTSKEGNLNSEKNSGRDAYKLLQVLLRYLLITFIGKNINVGTNTLAIAIKLRIIHVPVSVSGSLIVAPPELLTTMQLLCHVERTEQ